MTTQLAALTDPAGPTKDEIFGLGWLMTVLGTVAFLVFLVPLLIGLFRKRPPTEHRFPEPEDEPVGRWWLLGGGVVFPGIVIGVVFIASVAVMRGLYEAPPDALQIDIVGSQFWWEVRYPEAGFTTANEVHVPVGRPVELRVWSTDVIHSVWIPALGQKMDAFPDYINTFVIEAEEPAVYPGPCAEFCGLLHAKMYFLLVAQPPEEFDEWVELQQSEAADPEDPAAVRGQEVFLEAGCGDCHTVRGTPAAGEAGPDLTHLASRETLAAMTLENTEQNLTQWIADPHRFKPEIEMPPANLPEDELSDLVAYLETLR